MRIDIVGAGPAGSYCAYLLASKGHKVEVYEKDSEIGKPVQCTGILSEHFKDLMQPDPEFVLNIVNKTRIYSPDRNFIELAIKDNYVVCRKRFDSFLAKKAMSVGARYHLKHSFNDLKKGKVIISVFKYNNKLVNSSADILIGADGPLSPVAKSAGLFKDRRFIIGTQIEARKENDNVVEFYPYIGCYAWIVPVDRKTVRLGVSAYKDSAPIFRDFAKEKLGEYHGLILENQSGVIPVFNPAQKVQDRNIYLVGDAATFNKATTGGGINQALVAAKIISECIEKKRDYNLEWKKHLFANLMLHLTVHRMMQKFKPEDWNALVRRFSSGKMKLILKEESRDDLLRLVIRLLLADPGLLGYSRFLF